MHYTYVLKSENDGRYYVGATRDLKRRVECHLDGRVPSTAARRPLQVIYYEACMTAADAYRRERYLKSGRGGRYLRQRLASWLRSLATPELERH